MAEGLSIQSLCRVFAHPSGEVRAVDDVSLDIRANEFFTLLGPSGCGKTTLLRCVAGLERADRGRIILGGADIAPLPAHRRPVNTVFQSYALFPHMTVEENIAFGLKMQGRAAGEISGAVKEALALVRLEGMEGRLPAQLSGGQQQRVALARALVNRPKILLLDEPLSALDFKLRREMQVELKSLQRDTGITFIFVTHDQEEALSMSDRIAVMDRGRIVQTGAPQDIYRRPATRFVAGFIGICNFVKPASLGLEGGGEVGFRPEDAAFAANVPKGIFTSGSLAHVTYRGAVTHYIVRLDSGETVTVADNAPPGLTAGARVTLAIPPERIIRCAA